MSDVAGNPMLQIKAPRPSALSGLVSRHLQQRIASSVVMMAVSVGLLWAGPSWFTLLVIAVTLVLCWEWGHLVRGTGADVGFLVHAGSVASAIALAASGLPLPALILLLVGVALLASGACGSHPFLSAAGVMYAGAAAVALVTLRGDPALGLLAVLFLFLVVWTNDIMAFVCGRAIGGPKLWPAISPNKTWAGFIGGVVSSALAGAVFAMTVAGASPLRLAVIAAALGAVALGGDLAESALKRRFGVKDASDIIPGHGGVMDRMDGIVAVAVVAAVLGALADGRSLAAALLIGG